MAYPQPSNVAPWYLRNITQALALDELTGNVYVRTGFAGDIIIEGNVNIPGNVDCHIVEMGNIPLSGNTLPISGNVNVDTISGNVTVVQGTTPWVISGNVGITGNANIAGNVGILGNVNVTQGTTPWSVTGNVTTTPSITQGDLFGEPYAIPITPVVQTNGIYGVNNYDHQTYTAGGGNVSSSGSCFTVSCSSTAGSYGLIRSRRFNTYKTGQSFLARWFAKMATPVAGTSQRLGINNQESSYWFGYNGTTFGVLHTHGGKAPIYRVTVASYTGTQTVTLTLNGVAYTTTIQAGETTNQAASRISDINFGGLWLANDRDNTVELLYTGVGPLGGAFTVSGSGTSSLSIAQLQAGVAATNDWYLDGTDFTKPAWLIPTNFTSYEVKYSWSAIRFLALNPNTGQYEQFFQLGTTSDLLVSNPAFKVASLALNSGGASGVTVQVAGMIAALEGVTNRNNYTGATAVTKTGLTQNVLHHLLSIQNPYTFNSTINTIETLLDDFVATTQCNDPTEVYLYLDATLATGLQDFVSQDGYPVTISTATGTIDPATNFPILAFVVGNTGSSVQFDLSQYRLVIPPGSTISIGIRSTAAIQKASASLTWYND